MDPVSDPVISMEQRSTLDRPLIIALGILQLGGVQVK